MNTTKLARRRRYTIKLGVLVALVVVACGFTAATLVNRGLATGAAITDHYIATLYVIVMAALYLLVGFVQPRRRR